ncbi:MAG: hypothetical protein KME01_03555 [Chroococcus sp. CMT-3BRIN-NPC107]|jgi:hypothetical protein|nr:hypothetical protein [Chroococcus sp. CMT-3BRIN-NPC107]
MDALINVLATGITTAVCFTCKMGVLFCFENITTRAIALTEAFGGATALAEGLA